MNARSPWQSKCLLVCFCCLCCGRIVDHCVDREGLVVEETADGPRALTRAILKNKGLTPHRPKSVRNPRVKKRQRYDQAQRKLASQRAVFKEGPRDAARYEGERSGISKVVKSVRFS